MNEESVTETVAGETGETMDYIYISPKGCRFTSLKLALAHAKKHQPLLEGLPREAHATFNAPNSTSVEFTSNHEDYVRRGQDSLLSQVPAFNYNIWVYTAAKMTKKDLRAERHLDFSV